VPIHTADTGVPFKIRKGEMTDENDVVPEPVAEQAQVVDVLVELTELLNTLPSNKERMQVLSCACLIIGMPREAEHLMQRLKEW